MEQGRTDYPAHFVMKALSMYPDTLYYAYVLNLHSELPDIIQYRFLLNNIQKRDRRRVKWPKPVEDKHVDIVQQVFKYNRQRALETISLLSEQELRDLVAYHKKYIEPRLRHTQKARLLQGSTGDTDENRGTGS